MLSMKRSIFMRPAPLRVSLVAVAFGLIFKCRLGAATILGGVGWGFDSCPHQKRMRMGTLLINQGGFFNDRNHATISALRFWLHASSILCVAGATVPSCHVFFCATTAVCKLSFGSTSCRGHGVIHFKIMVVSSYIARCCFGARALKFP